MKEYPTQKTLDKYGLTRLDQKMILEAQGGVCPICEKVPTTGRWVIDHHHVKGWKDMPPEKRKLYVRGITCWFCNRNYLAKAITPRKAENIKRYLENYAIRQARAI
jgi:hypothetical protein